MELVDNGEWLGPSGGFEILNTPLVETPEDVLLPFAWDEWRCNQVGLGLLPSAIHIWRHPKALVLGLRDRRLPKAWEAIQQIRSQGVAVAVRNSGGAAVPLDSGVVNLSLVCPYEGGLGGRGSIHREFQQLAGLIMNTLKAWGVGSAHGEITGAYCPGEYDLSIRGRKFCGIAQRRQRLAYVVSAFINVEGWGESRARRASDFYRLATGGMEHKDDPQVQPDAMGSLQELADIPSAEAFVKALIHKLQESGGYVREQPSNPLEQEEVVSAAAELRERYD